MTAQIAAYGRLVADPQLKTTSKGTQMAMASMAVPLPCSQADDGTATMWLSVLAFGRQADALAKHHKGELLSVAGNMQVSQWTGQNNSQGMMNRTAIIYRFKFCKQKMPEKNRFSGMLHKSRPKEVNTLTRIISTEVVTADFIQHCTWLHVFA